MEFGPLLAPPSESAKDGIPLNLNPPASCQPRALTKSRWTPFTARKALRS